jgi:alpha-tubulin suppressor-like RCC1 family protein
MIEAKNWTDSNNRIHTIVQISAGESHSAFLSDLGMVFTCGFNDKGQLGHDTRDNASVPTLVKGDKVNKDIVSVQCGSNHTAMLNRSGEVFFCGDNQCGQFGIPNQEESPIPLKMIVPDNGIVRQLISSYDHTHVITLDGKIYGCGRATEGQLFLKDGDCSNQSSLVEVELPNNLSPQQIESITHGAYMTSIVTSKFIL